MTKMRRSTRSSSVFISRVRPERSVARRRRAPLSPMQRSLGLRAGGGVGHLWERRISGNVEPDSDHNVLLDRLHPR